MVVIDIIKVFKCTYMVKMIMRNYNSQNIFITYFFFYLIIFITWINNYTIVIY